MNNNSDLLPPPYYSAHDMFKDISNRMMDNFTYNNESFKVVRYGISYKVTRVATGHEAISKSYCNSMLDLQGMAACLIAENKNLSFDREGNYIN